MADVSSDLSTALDGNRRRARLVDIAKRANVSQMTVSKVLNPRGGSLCASSETVERIRRIAKELHYRPNLAARQLAGQRSHLIGAIVDSRNSIVLSNALAVMEAYGSQHGFRFMVGYVHDRLDRIKEHVEEFLGRDVEGVICMAHTYPEFGHQVPDLFSSFLNCVFIDAPLVERRVNFVSSNNYRGGYMAADHLLKLGRKRIGFSLAPAPYQMLMERARGYQDAYRDHQIPCDEKLTWSSKYWFIDSVETASGYLDEILPASPDALIVGSDESAMWIIRALSRRGIHVPQDIALVSMFPWPIGQAFSPTLTSIDQRFSDIAGEAIRLLVNDIQRPKDEERQIRSVIVEPRLIIGESSGG